MVVGVHLEYHAWRWGVGAMLYNVVRHKSMAFKSSAAPNPLIFTFDQPSAGANVIAPNNGWGLSEAARTAVQYGNIAAAVNGFRQFDGSDDYLTLHNDLIQYVFPRPQKTWMMGVHVKDWNASYTTFLDLFVGSTRLYIHQPVSERSDLFGVGALNLPPITPQPTSSDEFWEFMWCDGQHTRGGWVSTSVCPYRPTKWSDFPASQRASSDTVIDLTPQLGVEGFGYVGTHDTHYSLDIKFGNVFFDTVGLKNA
jgi:hypothetical protein